MHNYFCGLYFRCQSDDHTLALIPSRHRTKTSSHCSIQIITDTEVFYVEYPRSDFHERDDGIIIADNSFGRTGINLDIQSPDLSAKGFLRFSSFTPVRYDIMGPFRYVPFMQCRHSIFSMRHLVSGDISMNGIPYLFQNGIGYIEGDRGRSFPKEYMWTQCNFPDGALMLSIADIPIGPLHFTGVIGVVLLHGKEYRIATYLGAKAIKVTPEEIIVRQGNYALIINPREQSGYPLRAPIRGAMTHTIHEHPSCKVYYRFEKEGIPILELDAPNAALEYEY